MGSPKSRSALERLGEDVRSARLRRGIAVADLAVRVAVRHRLLLHRHEVQAAVRLDVVEIDTFRLQETGQRADLVDYGVAHLVARHPHFAPAKTLKVGQARMGADLDPVRLRAADGGHRFRRRTGFF